MQNDAPLIRLQKYIASCGVASRREAEKLITLGEIKVNNYIVSELGSRINPLLDKVKWRNRIIRPPTAKFYLALNKPAGVLCSLSDPQGRQLITDLIPSPFKKLVKPVGRLDYNTTGLILLSSDGEFIQLMTHPRHKMPKKYRVKVRGEVSLEKLKQLTTKVMLEDGEAKAIKARRERKSGQNAYLVITVVEGRKHLIKRMCEAVGLRVVKLSRIALGPLTLKDLKPGEYRELSSREVEMLKTRAR